VRLVATSAWRKTIAANDFNRNHWKPALDACAVPCGRYENGMHELRHSIKAVAEWLGHTDPAFTLATYTHLMPSSDQRTKEAIAWADERRDSLDGPRTAQGFATVE
jgi:integrase